MRVVHFSITPLAGAPIRLVQVLNTHRAVEARLVDAARWNVFDHDVVWAEAPDEAIALVEAADVIHLHNGLDPTSRRFAPIDFVALRRAGKVVVRQFHSHPASVARWSQLSEASLHETHVPSLVVGQFQERYYPNAYVVPNVLPLDDPRYRPSGRVGDGSVMFAFGKAYRHVGAWADRWNTKGVPETLALLHRLRARHGCPLRIVSDRSFDDALAARRASSIILDELVTGSYHLSSLEGLAAGRPTLAYPDDRCLRVLAELAGTSECPFVRTPLEEAEATLTGLLADPDEAAAIGRSGRAWLERHWSAERMSACFVDVYETLRSDPAGLKRPASLRLDTDTARRSAIVVPDEVHRARASGPAAARGLRGRLRRALLAVRNVL
ncbi:MAG: glycosyltransferase family 1 protein [Planctomycetota bacterium]